MTSLCVHVLLCEVFYDLVEDLVSLPLPRSSLLLILSEVFIDTSHHVDYQA